MKTDFAPFLFDGKHKIAAIQTVVIRALPAASGSINIKSPKIKVATKNYEPFFFCTQNTLRP